MGGHIGEGGGDKIGHSSNVDGEAVKDIVAKGGSGDGDDDIIGAGFPGVAQEFVKNRGLEGLVGGENSDLFTGGTENFVDVVGDDSLTGGAGDGDKFHVFDRVAIVRI